MKWSMLNAQLSIVNYQLSIINYQNPYCTPRSSDSKKLR